MSVNSFYIDDVYAADSEIYLQKGAGVDILPSSKVSTSKLVGRPGSYEISKDYGERPFNLSCFVMGSSEADRNAKLATLAGLIDIYTGIHRLRLDQFPDRYWNVSYNGSVALKPALVTGTFSLPLLAADPFGYGVNLTSLSYPLTTSPQTILTAAILGDFQAEPIWTLTPDHSIAEDTIISLNNVSSSQSISWKVPAGGMVASDVLSIVVSGNQWVIKLNGVASMAGYQTGGYFPELVAARANRIIVTGLGGGLLGIEYRSRFK